ncbi:hypothetical protein GH714_002052 [Hevea brasiliensis]|uniref:Response regulatory domain-containing protein n=1 Tax=Hevea brasiliensis TaxID=3981 RepID=A0A6A6MGV5_HEVBR|nr:hypothetical protein GH714_002052 [Hevea brasiliensis]
MAALQRVASSVSATASNYGSCKGAAADAVVSDQFPAGLRVLVVDDDITCLRILEQMLRRCLYLVTTCSQAKVALNLLRERKGCFDVVLSDVHMPDMDGFKLLEHVGLEMDLPVIMMSADGRTSAVMRGIRHGACDYLIKPIREEELKNIWQHVVRKKWNENKELEHSGSLEDSDRNKRGNDDAEYTSSVNEGTEGVLKEAVPKRILELMNVPGLTRENVASHLQKFRLYLKRLSGVSQQGGISNAFCGPLDSNVKLNALGRFDIQALAASGQIPPQTLAALHAELLGRPAGSLVTTVDQPALLQASIQGPKCIPVEHGVAFGQPLVKCQSNISKPFPQNMVSVEEVASKFGAWPSNSLSIVGPNTNLGAILPCGPSQSSASFQAGNSPASVNQSCNFNRNAVIDYSLLSSQSNNSSLNIGHVPDGNLKTTVVVSGYSVPGTISPSASSSSVNGSYGAKSGEVLDQGPLRYLGFVGKGTFLPSQFSVDEFTAPISNLSQGKTYVENNGSKVKQEPNMEFTDDARVGVSVLQQFPPNDLMSVFTE